MKLKDFIKNNQKYSWLQIGQFVAFIANAGRVCYMAMNSTSIDL